MVVKFGEDFSSFPVKGAEFSLGPVEDPKAISHDWHGKGHDSGGYVFGADSGFEGVSDAVEVLFFGFIFDFVLENHVALGYSKVFVAFHLLQKVAIRCELSPK